MPALVSLTAFILGAALTTPLDAQVIFEADFETNTGTNAFGTGSDQWTVNPNATDTATTGVWERGNPDRTDYQPGVTPSGDFALVTGANAMDPNAADPQATSNGFNDIDGGPTSVLSPQIVLPSSVFGLELSFESYASFSGGAGDFFRLTIIEVGGAGTTQEVINIESSPLLFGQYQRTSVDLTPFAGRTITILLESGDLNGGSFVEAGIDDVRVTVRNPTVGGNVRYDVNGDGDLAAAFTEDGPLAGVDLSIFEGTPAGQITGPVLQTVTSDRFGDFRFDNVPDGRYVVTSSTLAGAVSTGDSQGGNDDQIIVDIAGANINDLVFLDTTVAGGIPAATATYFLPYAESDILQALDTIESSAADPITSVTSISVAFDDTLILYDHWEDNGDEGYEGFLEAPAQALTQVWGDGNLVNGVAPGFPDDLLSAGDIIVLENTFETADAGSLPFYDGRDKVVVSKYVAVTKAAWADVSNTLLAGAWELYPTILWGRSFTLPVGEDMADAPAGETIPANQDDREMFEFTGASVMSAQDDNQVRLNGTLVAVLSEGEELTFNGGLNLGDRITTSRDAQVQLITGDVGATFESRWYTVQPDTNLSNSYVAPTSTPDGNGTLVWLYNGNDSEITIDIEISSNASLPDGNPDQSLADVPVPSLIVPPGRSVSYQLPNLKAARFSSQGEEIFFALAAVDASSPAEDNLTHDWGYSLVPEAFLSPLAVAGFAPGDDPTAEAVAENSAPLWVTAIFPTGSPNYQLNHDADPDNDVAITLCIDYQGNGNVDNLPTGGTDAASGREFDLQVTVESLEQLVIYTDLDGDGIPDPGEDQTGTRIWVCDGSDALIALAYGQDPNTASVGIPAVDLGTTVPGIPLLEVAKGVAVETDQNGNNFPDVGDVLRYTIDISNSGTAVFGASLIEITDNLNDFIRYVPDTTALVRTSGFDPIADNTVGSPFPIDSDGPTYVFPPSLQPEEGFAVTFLAEVIDLPANGTGALENNVVVAGGGNAENIQSAADIPIITGTIEGTVTEDTTGDAVGENLLDGVELILLRSDGTQVDFDESTPGVQPYTVTTLNGFYRFPNLPAGDYIVSQSQPAGFVSVSDGDSINGTDDAPNTSLTDNQIPVSIGADEVDDGNDFVERMQNLVTEGAISGFVEVDSDNDDVADAPLPGVELVLRDAAGNDIDSDPNTAGIQPTVAITGFDGSYSFSGLAPGDFRVVQTQPSGFISVSDTDGFNDNVIGEENAIVVVAGGTNGQNNFLEEPVGSLSGNVSADSDGNGSGDQPLFGVLLTLQDDAGNDIDSDGNPDNGVQPTTTSTDSTGSYQFSNLAPGSYLVVETQPANFRSVSDADGGDLDVVGDQVPIIVTGEANTPGNNFVEEALGSVSGSVLAFTAASPDTAVAQPFVVVTLKDAAGNDIDSDGNPDNGVQPTTATTDEFGAYSFDNLPAADYQVVETQPAGFGSVSDIDGENNNTIGDENTLTVSPGETNSGNDFVNAELGSVSGNVTAFTAANTAGDAPLENVVLTLRDENGADIDSNPATPEIEPTTTTTDSTGAYSFGGLLPANYQVVESQPSGFSSVSDTDGENNNTIGDENAIVVVAGTDNGNNDFVEAALGSVSGSVLAFTAASPDTAAAQPFAVVTLKDAAGNDIDSDGNPDNGVQPTTATTDEFGAYSFDNLPAADYQVVETQPAGFGSVSDIDGENNNTIGDENTLTVSPGETNSGNDFINAELGSVSGNVTAFTAANTAGDAPLENVVLTLRDENGADIDSNPATPEIEPTTTTTDSTGAYSFGGLLPANYQVVESQPSGFSSVSDTDGENNNTIGDENAIVVVAGTDNGNNDFVEAALGAISGFVLSDTDNDGDGDEGITGVTLTLQNADGSDIDSDGNPDNGVQPTTTQTLSGGDYLFENLPAGNYRVVESQPEGFDSVGDTDGENNNIIGDETAIVVVVGETAQNNNFVELADSSKADTFAEWSADFAQELGTQTGLGENPDGDIYPNALEYAFWLNPGLGLPDGGEFCLTKSADGTVTAEFQRRRGGLSDVTYTLEIADTLEIPTAWVEASSVSPTVTAGGAGIPFDAEMVSYNNLENASELTSANNGVVRLRVEVDANGNGSIESEEVFFTQIFGWQCVDYNDYQCATFANPFKAKPVFSGTFDPTGVLSLGTDPEGNVTLDVASAANGTDLVDVVGSDGEFYLQVTSGFLEGERFDILGGGVDSLTLINDPAIFDDENVVSLNTSNGIPADPMFNGASYQVIRHATVGDVFDESTIFAGEEDTNPSDTTRLLFFDSRRATPGFDILMLIGTNSSNARWVFSNDLGAQTDQANLRLDPSRGNWIHPKSSGDPANPATEVPVTQFTFGVVADYAQAAPINAGFNLLGAMWPLDQTPAGPNGRDWTVASGFDGGVDPNNATELLFWVGDAVADDLAVTNYTEGYENYMLLDGGGMQNWVDINDFFLTNQDELLNLESHRSVFLELLSGDEKEPHFYPLPNY